MGLDNYLYLWGFEGEMKLQSRIKRLEKRGIISRKPHPAIPFILTFIILILGIVTLYLDLDKIWT